jgi:hypothetical protein
MIQLHHQALPGIIKIRNRVKRLPFPRLRTLPVTRVQ